MNNGLFILFRFYDYYYFAESESQLHPVGGGGFGENVILGLMTSLMELSDRLGKHHSG